MATFSVTRGRYFQRSNADLHEVFLIANGQGNISSPLMSTNYDAFGRLRVSNPHTIFDSKNVLNQNELFSESTSGTASTSYLVNESSIQLSIGSDSGDEVIEQTKRNFTYQPGKSFLILNTFVFGDSKENLRQRAGYFGTQNGIFLQRSGSTISWIKRSYVSGSVVDTVIDQENWNGDKLDGSGPSGVTLDLSQSQIQYIDIEWLGVGNVRTGFVINGKFIVCHTFENANVNDTVYMTTPSLPIRFEMTNTAATSGSSTMKRICATVISEGGYNRQVATNIARRTSTTSVGVSFEPLVSIRLASDSLEAIIIPKEFNVLATSSGDDFEIAMIRNATLTGASYDTSTFDHVDFDTSATALSGGEILDVRYASQGSFFAPGGNPSVATDIGYNYHLQLGRTLAGTSDIITLAARVLTGTGDIIGNLSFYDLT